MARTDPRINITAHDRTKAAFSSVERRLKGLSGSILGLRGGLVGLVGAAGFGALVRSTVQAGDNLQKLSIRLGSSTEALSQLRHVADLSGVSFNTLTLGMQRSTRRIAEAAQGTGEAKNALLELGLSASDLVKLKPEQQLEAIADAMLGVENQADKVRLAMKLFDTEGVALLQTMEKGAAGIREIRAEADQLGLTMSRADADALAKFKDTMTRLNARFTGLIQTMVISFGPAVTDFVTKIQTEVIPALKFWAEKLFGIKSAIDSLTEDEILARMAMINERMAAMATGLGPTDPVPKEMIERLREYRADLAKLQEQLDILRSGKNKETETGAGGGGGIVPFETDTQKRIREEAEKRLETLRNTLLTEEQLEIESHRKRLEQLIEFRNENVIPTDEQFHLLQQAEVERHESAINEITKKKLEERAGWFKELEDTKLQYQQKAANNAIGILKMLGQKNKAFAIAAILLERAMAIKSLLIEQKKATAAITVSTLAGQMKAIEQLGIYAGPAVAAIGTAGAGAIAAVNAATVTGIAGQVIGGAMDIAGVIGNDRDDAQGTFAVDPVTGQPVLEDGTGATGATGAATGRRFATDITINIGDVPIVSADAIRQLIDRINEQIDDGVVINSIKVA